MIYENDIRFLFFWLDSELRIGAEDRVECLALRLTPPRPYISPPGIRQRKRKPTEINRVVCCVRGKQSSEQAPEVSCVVEKCRKKC